MNTTCGPSVARKMLETTQTQTGQAAMYNNVSEFPVDHLSDRELRLREWEVVMAGGYGSSEHKRLQNEMWRRTSNMYAPAQARTTH